MEPVLRDGQWWFRSKSGGWLRWDVPSKQWRPTVLEPPPAPVPPPLPPDEGEAFPQGAETEPVKIRSGRPAKTQPITGPLAPGPLDDEPEQFPMGPASRRPNLGIAIGIGAVVLLLIIFAAVRIFGGEDEPEPAVEREDTAKAEYIAAADELCSKARSVEESLSPPRSDKELLEFALRVQSIRTSLGRKIARLDPPKGDEKILTKMSKAYGSALRQLAITIEELRQGNDKARARAGQRATALTEKFNNLASDYGFKECNHIGEPA
jgi:hypothetical protein